jgi:protoporphyrinogen/coproporphyrinogen III oxidase
MNQPMTSGRKRVVVVGGGISGLAAAHRLGELDATIEVTLLEAGQRAGGVIETVRRDGYLIEHSADNFITNVPWAVDLCRRIGLAEQLIPTTSGQRSAMVVRGGRLVHVPAGFMLMAPARIWPLVTTPLLSPWGKLRLLAEYFVPRRKSSADESLASFARRRLGREAFERIVQPLVGGIYAADPERLSLHATMPRFAEMERRYGSLIRAARSRDADANARREESGARYGLFVTPREGLGSLVEAIAAKLAPGSVRLSSPVERIGRDEGGTWIVTIAGGASEREEIRCEAVIVATGAPAASAVLRDLDSRLAADLGRIAYSSTSIVLLAYRRDQIAHPLDGFGFVVPACEKRRILAGSFSSVKFAGRAPEEMVLVRVFIGGACQSELADLPDDELRRIAADELRELLGTRGEPAFADVARWPRSMPQYHVGHGALVAAIERAAARLPGLALAGNAYHGVGIPACIHSGEAAAERIAAELENAGSAIGESRHEESPGEAGG